MGRRNGGIRKELMKKFGTPIGAGPGSEKEKVGLAGVGTSPAPMPDGVVTVGLAAFGFGLALPLAAVFVWVTVFGLAGAPWWLWLCGEDAFGLLFGGLVFEGEVEVEVVLVVDVVLVDVVLVVDVVPAVEVVPVVDVLLVEVPGRVAPSCGHSSFIDAAGWVSGSEESGAPAGSW
jgi:hypothetical protein